MAAFLLGHATHPDWRTALALTAAQIDAQIGANPEAPTLGLVYLTDHYAGHAGPLLDELRQRWPGLAWAGCTGVGICATGAEYFDEPALAVMLCRLPRGSFEVFSGARGADWSRAHTALVHADPSTPDLPDLLGDLSGRLATGYLFGGVVSSRGADVQVADGVLQGGLSGVAFDERAAVISRVTQGCQPVGPERLVGRSQDNLVMELDGRSALDCLVGDLGIDLSRPREAIPRLRATLVGLSAADDALLGRGRQFGPDVRVRHLVGLDPGREAVAVADRVETGMRLAFCQRDVQAARRDLVRVCSEIRDEVADGDGRSLLGAVYVSCTGRGGAHFGGPSAELKIVQHALGDVPLVGFFANGEIARRHLYGYTGVLTAFTGPASKQP